MKDYVTDDNGRISYKKHSYKINEYGHTILNSDSEDTISIIITSTNGDNIVLIDKADYDCIKNATWAVSGSGNTYYSTGTIDGKKVRMHRLIMNCPDNLVVDHINGNGLDNRRSNLRICKSGENSWNHTVRKNSKTGYKGVQYKAKSKKYFVHVHHLYSSYYVGQYDTAKEAALAYNEAVVKYHGEFSKLNVIVD